MAGIHRMREPNDLTNAHDGRVVWSPDKSLWYSGMLVVGVVGGIMTFEWSAIIVSAALTVATLCLGHSVGLHRLLIHRSFRCPLWLEYLLVYIGVLVGMRGPRRILYMHDIRDWSQRSERCHPLFSHQSSIWRDWLWQNHCEVRLNHPPEFVPERRVTESRFYRFLDRTWMLQQLPLAGVLFWLGGWPWVVWGICVRVAVSLTGHWLVGYIVHNRGSQDWLVEGASIQGHNIPALSLLTMGESWHNNHHAFPESARLGIKPGQFDPGWWFISTLKRLGLATHVKLPSDLPHRPELRDCEKNHRGLGVTETSTMPSRSKSSASIS